MRRIHRELIYRLTYLLALILIPVYVPLEITSRCIKALIFELKHAAPEILPLLKEIPVAIRIILNPRWNKI